MNKLTQAQFFRALSDRTGLSLTDAKTYYEALVATVHAELGDNGPGVIQLPNLLKIRMVDTPAKPERPGRNPATGETIMLKAKPASRKVKVTPLKALKDVVI